MAGEADPVAEDDNKEIVETQEEKTPVEKNEILEMSDADFMNMTPPVGEPIPVETPNVSVPAVPGTEELIEEEKETPEENAEDDKEKSPVVEPDNKDDKKKDVVVPPSGSEEKEPEKKEATEPKSETTDEKKNELVVTPEVASDFYQKVMTPFKANGREIKLNSPEEAIQLMQMGANYTKKMQAIQPHRKVLTMLENNGLLDEGKLSFLIDLDKKDPEAIKKLIKDADIDPVDIDMSVDPAYLEGNHTVSDKQVNFQAAIEDVTLLDGGVETIKVINDNWDQASKDVLWEHPELMTVIHQQKANGIYDQIAQQVEHRRTLGQISPNTPFLKAYQAVGDEMFKASEQDAPAKTEVDKQAEDKTTGRSDPDPANAVATRAAKPKTEVDNGDKASAASPTRSTPKTAETKINPLSLPDDEFLQQMKNRV